ncbi:MAG: ATP-binding protein, partial [Dehalococcoidia bacterium]
MAPESGAQTPFVGRQVERDRCRAELRAAIDGRPRVLLLQGDAGIGKTRLAREVEADAEALGMQTVFGRFIEDGQTPFLAFASAFVPQCE